MDRLIAVLLAILLSACSSEDVETANFGSDYYKSDYQLVNATHLELDFYMANAALDGDEREPFKDKYKVAHITQEQTSQQISHEHNAGRKVSFYVHAPYADKTGYRETHKVKRDRHYLWLAWMSGEALSHSLFDRYESNLEGYIRVRLFATDTALQANNSEQIMALTIGKASEFISVDQCNGGLQVNGTAINLCDASFGRSYLLVVSAEGRVSLALQ